MAEKGNGFHRLMEQKDLLNVFTNADMVMGTAITTASGFQIIPFSKITIGSLIGGGEYGDVKVIKEVNEMPFAGGNGTVVSLKPLGFLLDDGKSCRIVRITDEPLDTLIEKASDIVKSITMGE